MTSDIWVHSVQIAVAVVPRHARLNVKVSQGLCGYFDNFGSWGVKNLVRKKSILVHHLFLIFKYLQIFTDRMCWKWKRCVESERSVEESMEELEVYSSVLLDRSGFLESQMQRHI